MVIFMPPRPPRVLPRQLAQDRSVSRSGFQGLSVGLVFLGFLENKVLENKVTHMLYESRTEGISGKATSRGKRTRRPECCTASSLKTALPVGAPPPDESRRHAVGLAPRSAAYDNNNNNDNDSHDNHHNTNNDNDNNELTHIIIIIISIIMFIT